MNRHIINSLLFFMTITTSTQAQQFLPVKGIVNARDLGGYAAADGHTIRSGLLIRAASLADATDSDIKYLAQIPVVKVIDFRQDFELSGREDKIIPGTEYVRIPINSNGNAMDDEDAIGVKKQKKFDVRKLIMIAAFNKKAQQVARDLYPNMVTFESCQKRFARFLRILVESPDSGAVFFHCTQGKDRTGLASAYLLAALGVDRETIIADFDATNAVYEKDVKRLSRRVRFWGGKEDEIGVVKAFIGANTDNFIKTLNLIDSTYGSMEAYLKGPLGLTDADIAKLRERYLM